MIHGGVRSQRQIKIGSNLQLSLERMDCIPKVISKTSFLEYAMMMMINPIALCHASSRDATSVDALRTYLESLPTQTAISSAIRVLVRLLLLYTARSRRASHLLLGTSLTTLSISLISCISLGGGHSILEELQEEWHSGIPTTKKDADAIRVVRPLRDATMKECSMFAWWNSIHVVGRDRQTRATAGIPGLTKGIKWLLQLRAF